MSEKFKPSDIQNNVRQLGSAVTSANHQSQILSALDVLGAKLVRSESERETMRRLLNEAIEAQDRLETQIERSQIHIERRLDQMEDRGEDTDGLSEEDKNFIAEQKRDAQAAKETLDDTLKRQVKVEDKMRDAQQTIQKLQRRLDASEQKRTKLQRRIERVENIAADAQNALEAKAIVLLTDQTEQVRELQNLQALQTQQTLRALENTPALPTQDKRGWLPFLSQGSSALAIVMALGLGWFMASQMNPQPTQQAFIMTADGQIAAMPIDPATVQSQVTSQEATAEEFDSMSIEADIALASTDWITEAILDEALAAMEAEANITSPQVFDMIEMVVTPDITMDRDLSLPDEIKLLEDKAFDKVAEAQHDLAALYTAGQAGVTQNFERAAFWFEQAAHQNLPNAAYNLGVLYQQGLGQEQDIERALDWYRRAALSGHAEAQYNLGTAYIESVGTRYNPAMAAAFFEQAAYAGIVEAAYNLGLILENGLLGEVRKDTAMIWYRAAAENGNGDALQALQTLAQSENITVEQAGLLQNGQSLAVYMNPLLSTIEPAAGEADTSLSLEDIKADLSLEAALPDEEQMLIAQIQEQLRKNGLYTGPQDGVNGSGTIKAIQSYQRQHNLTTNGEATAQLFAHMLQQATSPQ